ncbi:MAG: class I SAM-dependent methyltransferase [Devosia sp.]
MSAFPDQTDVKRAIASQWDQAANGWDENTGIIRPWLRAATDAMMTMANISPGMHVLDVAAGAGDQTLDLAARVGLAGSVTATDLSPGILAYAKANAANAGHANVETVVADGETLPFDDETFDAVVCRLGLMLFPAPLAGLQEMHRTLKPDGRICTVVFSSAETNPCLAILMSTARKHAGLPPADPYRPGGLLSLGKPGFLEDLFVQAGLRETLTTRVNAPFRLGSVGDYLNFVRTSGAPVQQILQPLDSHARVAAWCEIETRLAEFRTHDGWVGPNELLLTTGIK